MNKTLQKHFKELEQYSDLGNPENDMSFADVVDKIVLTKAPEAIPFLLKFINDDGTACEYTDESWLNWIESFEAKDYIPALLIELKDMFLRASFTCEVFISRLLDDYNDLHLLKQNIHLADKDTMLKLLDNMENDKYCPEEHKPIIKELRELVKE